MENGLFSYPCKSVKSVVDSLSSPMSGRPEAALRGELSEQARAVRHRHERELAKGGGHVPGSDPARTDVSESGESSRLGVAAGLARGARGEDRGQARRLHGEEIDTPGQVRAAGMCRHQPAGPAAGLKACQGAAFRRGSCGPVARTEFSPESGQPFPSPSVSIFRTYTEHMA